MTRTNLPALQKLILIFLADRHDTRNDECVFSHDRLASEAGLSTRATRYQLVKLEERGLIRKLPRIVAGKGQTYNDYKLNIAGLPKWATENKKKARRSEPFRVGEQNVAGLLFELGTRGLDGDLHNPGVKTQP
jgi:hypothetical protein